MCLSKESSETRSTCTLVDWRKIIFGIVHTIVDKEWVVFADNVWIASTRAPWYGGAGFGHDLTTILSRSLSLFMVSSRLSFQQYNLKHDSRPDV